MITKYAANYFSINIEEVPVERETEKSVFVHGNWLPKKSHYKSYHSSWDEAAAALNEVTENEIKYAETQLAEASDWLAVKKRNNFKAKSFIKP